MAEGKYVIDGFIFNNKADYLQAKNEYDGVEYMRSRTNMNNAANVFSVYKSLVEKGVFSTPVGMSYLYELRSLLIKNSDYAASIEEMPIPVASKADAKDKRSLKKNKDTLTKGDVIKNMKKFDIESVYRNRFISSLIVIFLLVIIMIFMMIITKNSSNTNILNYKNRIDAQYEDKENSLVKWENDLKLREEAVKQKEKELGNEP
ncbi:MAG: hypothetical protein IIW92_06035 [Lachnospiraceae bacterium]|nr:hypothetical protein [Lachnospiraceae bacterium]MEE0861479.1 hypothetical protein [Lachnospiraceae bacterium]